jgi:hypothetical protein
MLIVQEPFLSILTPPQNILFGQIESAIFETSIGQKQCLVKMKVFCSSIKSWLKINQR